MASMKRWGTQAEQVTWNFMRHDSPSTRAPLHVVTETLDEPSSCVSYAPLSTLKEWTQRHVEYNESEIFKSNLAKFGAWRAETPEVVTVSIIFCSVQLSLPWFLTS
jgi:hypothetical protein